MLSIALQNAFQGMSASQRRSEIASRNIANATTSGYTRKETVIDSGPLGLKFRGVARIDDQFLSREVRQERAKNGGLSAQAEAQGRLVDQLGDPQAGTTPADAISRFADAYRRLNETPSNVTVQQEVVNNAISVTNTLNSLDQHIRLQREQADRGISDGVTSVNDALTKLDTLNKRLGGMLEGEDKTELLDQRDRLVSTVMENVPVRIITRSNDRIALITDTGATLLDDSAHKLAFDPATNIHAAYKYNPSGGGLSGLTVDGIDITPGSGTNQALTTGKLSGLFAVRDDLMPKAQSQIDDLASVVADAFQKADTTVTAGSLGGLFLDGSAAHDRSDADDVVGLAGRLTVNPLVRSDMGGASWRVRDGVNAATEGAKSETTQTLAFVRIFDTAQSFSGAAGLSSSARIVTYAADFVSYQGSLRASMDDQSSYQTSMLTSLESRLSDKTGIDIDQQLQDVMMIEKAYAANAQVMSAAMNMLDELLNI